MINQKIYDIIPVIKRYFSDKPVLRAWLFGSCSRGEETPMSDIDILVDYDESNGVVSLLKIGGMLMELSHLLGRQVDLVESQGLKEYARASVDRDKILIYERES
ncbi:MAG: nucleotidyltransferase domain-containing protein [Muribaculaceae bacterium]|nr:nucleotidyltransferase domain-containing protein [Muribaculaceae bacterium]